MTAERPRHKKPPPPLPLSIGARLGGYEVRKVLGVGSFGIVYRVTDHDAERDLAVKEYLPTSQAVRAGTHEVVARSPADAEAFGQGLRFFISEGELLARIEHPSLVKVYRSWQDNGTAYRAMTLVHGRTLADTLQVRWKSPNEASLRAMLDCLLGALDELHRAGIQHRDIAPQNIVLEPNGRPVLLDLDSPRRVTSAAGDTGALGPRDGYAPIELYRVAAGMVRGPWTDFYSLAATLHFLIAGKPPPAALSRSDGDQAGLRLRRPDRRHSLDLLAVIDWMLAPRPADRPQSVAELRDALAGNGVPGRHEPSKRLKLAVSLQHYRRWLWIGAALVIAIGLGLVVRQLQRANLLDWLSP